jgi:hypothetical protein
MPLMPPTATRNLRGNVRRYDDIAKVEEPSTHGVEFRIDQFTHSTGGEVEFGFAQSFDCAVDGHRFLLLFGGLKPDAGEATERQTNLRGIVRLCDEM